jgi:hypothetical protein
VVNPAEWAKIMPKNGHSARRQDAHDLALLADLTHSEAVKWLTGTADTGLVDEARRIIEEFRQAAVARATSTGQSVRLAKKSLLHERELLPADSDFPRVHPDDTPWSVLHGVHVRCERRTENATRSLSGVVLPARPGRPDYRLRIALTASARGREPGDVISVDMRFWSVDPSVDQLQDARSNRSRCSAGRPLYTEASLPGDILASVPALRRRRLLPARTQASIATLRAYSGRTTPLYAVADAVSVPAATARQAKSVQRSRTCCTCKATSEEPLQMARDGRYYCAVHLDPAVERVKNAEIARGRAVSAVWAQRILADPSTLLIVLLGKRDEDLKVRAEDVHGAVILDQRLAAADIADQAYDLSDAEAKRSLPAWVGEPAAQEVRARRRVLLVEGGADVRFAEALRAASGRLNISRYSLLPRHGDRLRYRHRIWSGQVEPPYSPTGLERTMGPEWVMSPFSSRRKSKDFRVPSAGAIVAEMRTMLHSMAKTQLNGAEAAHAERYLEDEFKAVNRFAARHARALHAADLMRVFGSNND